MSMPAIRLTRMRMYALIDAFERDMRDNFEKYVIQELTPEEALDSNYNKAFEKLQKDDVDPNRTSVVEYLDFAEIYNLLNRHRNHLPEAFSRELRELTSNVGHLTSIRNRVMHGRPLRTGDPESLVSMLNCFSAVQWRSL